MIAGYIIYYAISLYKNTNIILISGFLIQFIIVRLAYKGKTSKILFQIVILTVLMMFGELIASLIIQQKLGIEIMNNITVIEDFIFTVVSKIIYFIFVVIFRQVSINKNKQYSSKEMIWLIILPITTCAFLVFFNHLNGILPKTDELLCIAISIMMILSTLVGYIISERMTTKNIEIQYLQSVASKHEMDNKSYQLIKEKYDEIRIMAHDFNKYCNSIEGLLSKGQNEALHITRDIKNKSKEFLLVEYTNNTALNILLSQKMKECNERDINFQLYVKDIDLSFIEEVDVIAIFANLIDNAIESCQLSSDKKIFLSINIMNDSYIIIRIDNNADNEPIIINNRLYTWKKDKENHGIGFLSIQKAIAKYNGSMRWEYNSENHTFTTIIMINISQNHNEN